MIAGGSKATAEPTPGFERLNIRCIYIQCVQSTTIAEINLHLHSCLVELLLSQISLLNEIYIWKATGTMCTYIIHRELCALCLALRGTDAAPRPLARRWPGYERQISREVVALAVVHGGWLLCRHGVLYLNTWSRHVWRTAATSRKVYRHQSIPTRAKHNSQQAM